MSQDERFRILQAFASLTPTKNILWPSAATLEGLQLFLVDQLISSEHFRLYPPSATYQKSFWKWIISSIEEYGEEVREEIYSHYLSLLGQSPAETITPVRIPAPSYVTYIWGGMQISNGPKPESEVKIENYHKYTLFEARTTTESGTTGLRTWTASLVLAEYLTRHRSMLKSSRILELGSGAGFLGIVLAQLQMEEIKNATKFGFEEVRPSLCLTDLDERVLRRCEGNIKLPCNKVTTHPELRITPLDWTDALDSSRRHNLVAFFKDLGADLILGADLVYDPSIIPALVTTLHLVLNVDQTNSPKKAIIAVTRRNGNTLGQFVAEIEETGLRIEELGFEQNGISQHFLRNQPDAIGENISHVIIFVITKKD